MPLVKCEQSLDSLMDKHVLFAGRRVPLSSLIMVETNNNNQCIDESSLQELINETEPVIDTRAAEPHYSKLSLNIYINRTLVQSVAIPQHSLQNMSDNCSFCFSIEDFNKQVELHPKQPVHFISTVMQDESVNSKTKHYIWKKSHGGIGQLRNYLCRYSSRAKHEWIKLVYDKDLLTGEKGDQKFVIIVGPEGTGKSTLLTYLTELVLQTNDSTQPLKWPVRINLNEHSSFLTEERTGLTDFETAFKFLTDLIKWPRQQTNNLAKSLLRHRLASHEGGVVLMFDGLDEIGVKAQDDIINLMDCLSKLGGVEKVIVTGRSRSEGQPCARLEDRANTLSYQLLDFSRNDKLQYVIKHWQITSSKQLENYPADEVKQAMHEYANQVIAIKSAETGEETFGNWPFQCKMLAEIFYKDLLIALRCRNTKLANPLSNQSFSYLDLYRLFWAAKCDAFHSCIVQIVPLDVRSREDAVNILTCYLLRIGIKFCLLPIDAASFYYHCDDPPKWIVQNIFQDIVESLHLTSKTSEGLLKLSHPLLAEYLIAEFLFNHLQQDKSPLMKSPSIRDLLINKILVTDEFKGIRIFLNAMMECAISYEDYHEPFGLGARVPNIFNHGKYNDRLVQLVSSPFENSNVHISGTIDRRKVVLENTVYERSVGILSWLFLCAKESLMRANRGLKWHESMLNFLSPVDSTFLHALSARCELDVQVSERVFRWFENADADVLKQLLDYSRRAFIYPKVVLDFILRHKSLLDADYLASFLFNSGEKHCLADMLGDRNVFEELDGNCVDLTIDYLKQIFTKGAAQSQASDWFMKIDWGVAVLDGALLKLLNLLVEHFELKEADVRRVVSHAIKMDARVFLNGDRVTFQEEEWPLGEILKTDAFFLTNLHRAAMYGSIGAVRKMLRVINKGKVLNDTLADKIAHSILIQDLHGVTPLYLVARCGHQEICETIIRFQQSHFPYEIVKLNTVGPGGCLYRALTDAVPVKTVWTDIDASRCNFEAIQCVIVVVLRHYGRESLRSLIVRESWTLLFSMFKNLHDSSVVIVKLLKFLYHLVGMDGLADIFCNPLHLEIVARFVAESQNEVLRLVLESILICKGGVALVNFLLAAGRGHHEDRDLLQNVASILRNPVVRSYLPGKLTPTGLQRFVELLTFVRRQNEGGRSFWSFYCSHMIKPLDHVGAILRSTLNEPTLGEGKVRDLVVHDDGKGSIFELATKRGWKDLIQVMLEHLPTMARQIQVEFSENLM